MTEDRIRCVICAKADPAAPATTCRGCLNRIDDDLAAIVILTRAAANHITPAVKATEGGGGRKPGSKPPLDVAALDDSQAADALPLLESWERLVREHYGLSPYGPASLLRVQRGAITLDLTLEGCTAFLRSWLPRLAETDTFPLDDLAHEIHACRTKLNRYAEPKTTTTTTWSLPCPGDHPDADGRSCAHQLTITTTPGQIITCDQCGIVWTARMLITRGIGATLWAYPADIEAVLGIPASTLRSWHQRGHIRRAGGRYDIANIIHRTTA